MADMQRVMPQGLAKQAVRRALLVLLTAWMLVQTIGVLHRVAHAHPSFSQTTQMGADTSGALVALWGDHSNSIECQLFDQACPDFMPIAAWTLHTTLPAVTWVVFVLQKRFALFERYYAARGPPVALI